MQLEAGTADSWGWLLWVFVALWGISAGFSAQCFYALWSTELFPTLYRGGRAGIMFFLVRGVLGVWSLVAVAGLGVETPSGFVTAGIIMCGFLLVSLVVGVIWCPNTQGRTLDEITEEPLRQAHRLAARWARPLVERVLDSATFRNGPASSGPFS